jgi:hypothetical protein
MPAACSIPKPEDDMRLAVQVDVPVLTTAGSREQRDLCARFIHATSSCWHGAFVTFSGNGAASTVEAAAHQPGDRGLLRRQFDLARGGTFFIDDIVTLSARAQRQLLCLLEEHVLPDSSPLDLPASVSSPGQAVSSMLNVRPGHSVRRCSIGSTSSALT